MPYRNIDFNAQRPTYEEFYTFEYNNDYSFDDHMKSLGKIFDRPRVSISKLEKMIQKYLPDYSSNKIDRSKQAVEARTRLSKVVQTKMLENHLKRSQYMASAETEAPKVGSSLKYPYDQFLRISDKQEDLDFNQKLVSISTDPDTKKKSDFLFQEFEKSKRALEINTPEDTMKLMKLEDTQMVEKFDQIKRFYNLAEALTRVNFMENEHRKDIFRFVNQARSINQYCGARMNCIANPYYAQLGADFFQDQYVAPLAIALSNEMEKTPAMSKAVAYFDMVNITNAKRAENLLEEFYTKDPTLKDADLFCSGRFINRNPVTAFAGNTPVTAFNADGTMKMLIPTHPTKILPIAEYMKDLADEAARTNRRMLTGSSAFSDMEKALGEMMKFNQENNGIEERKSQAYWDEYKDHITNLTKAAENYLKYKNIKEPFIPESVAGKGKNQREQRRLNVALSVLNMAQEQYKAIDFEIGQEVDLEKIDLAPREGEVIDPDKMVLENMKVPKGFLDEDTLYNLEKQDEAVKKAIKEDREQYDERFAEDIKENRLELDVVLRFDEAKLRLSKYSSGDIKPDSKEFLGSDINSNKTYQECVISDLNKIVFRYALELEDIALTEDNGVLWGNLKEKGYETGLNEFSKLTADTNAFARAGLKDINPDAVKEFLDQNGCKNVAKALLYPPSEKRIKSQDQKRPELEMINEVDEKQHMTEIDHKPSESKHSKPMTMPF